MTAYLAALTSKIILLTVIFSSTPLWNVPSTCQITTNLQLLVCRNAVSFLFTAIISVQVTVITSFWKIAISSFKTWMSSVSESLESGINSPEGGRTLPSWVNSGSSSIASVTSASLSAGMGATECFHSSSCPASLNDQIWPTPPAPSYSKVLIS